MSYRTALVTGASSGIGRGLALRLAAAGAHVVLVARRADALAETAEAIRAAGGKAEVRAIDVGDTTATVAAIRAADAELGGLDLVVANAGIGVRMGKGAHSWEAMANMCHVNFCGAVATLTAVLPQMIERDRGHLVGVSSLAALGPLPGSAGYCAPKAGLSMFLECLRIDLAGTGVAATTIHPGFIKTAMTEGAKHPMPQLVELDDACDLLMRRLPSRPAVIDFPQPFATVAAAAGRMPRPLRSLIARALPKPGRPRT